MKNHKITILLGTYNGVKYLEEQLESLLDQTHENWSLYVHDDGSEDDTLSILIDYNNRYPEKIKLLQSKNSYRSASQNFGYLLGQTDAEYIMFCDQDDVWYPQKIEMTLLKMLEMEEMHPESSILIHTDLTVADENLNKIDDSFWHYAHLDPDYDNFERLLMQNIITGCTVMINRALKERALPIPKGAIMHDWWLGLVAARFGKIGYISEVTMAYRQHNNNDTGAKRFGLYEVLQHFLRYFDSTILHQQILRNRLQAESFLVRFSSQLKPKELKMLEMFIELESLSFVDRRKVLLKYGLLKQGWIRNAGLLARI
ncbi:MAG: glycosyltransferase family 2 protein [Epsilonproteobacteria bacterium]|nr:MAG: glycosyltransferase family 2 protein [Campylobacterota bacterium]